MLVITRLTPQNPPIIFHHMKHNIKEKIEEYKIWDQPKSMQQKGTQPSTE